MEREFAKTGQRRRWQNRTGLYCGAGTRRQGFPRSKAKLGRPRKPPVPSDTGGAVLRAAAPRAPEAPPRRGPEPKSGPP